MADHIFLPTLRSDANVKAPSRAGHWESSSGRILRQVSDGLAVAGGNPAHDVSSVPDVWARPLMVKAVLTRGAEHPLWPRMIGEWRGLLSLLALRDVKKYGVEIVRVELGTLELEAALRRLAPRAVQLEPGRAYPWTEIFLVKWDGVALGALSPATLVYTGGSYQRELAGKHHTLVDAAGYLRPPLGLEDVRSVHAWAARLRDDFDGRNTGGVPGLLLSPSTVDRSTKSQLDDVDAIRKLLQSWLDDLERALSDAGMTPLPAAARSTTEPTGASRDVVTHLAAYPVYARLLRPLKLEGAPSASDMALTLKGNRGRTRQVVVITKHLLQSNARIWENVSLADLGVDADGALRRHFDGASGDRLGDFNLGASNAMWIRPEKYFLSDVLLQAGSRGRLLSDAVQDANKDARFLLPFRREILDFFSPAEIVKLLKPSYRQVGDAVVFSFILPVGSGAESIERTYRPTREGSADGVLRTGEAPAIEIFPDYVNENWRRYYLFQTDADSLSAEPIASASDVTITSRVRRTSRRANAESVRVWSLRGAGAFPQAVQVGSADDVPFGLILLDHDDGHRLRNEEWNVGVDFGTTNTQVFFSRAGGGTAQPLTFDFSRVRSLTAADDRRRALAREHFVPGAPVTMPVPTALRLFDRAASAEPLLDHMIYFDRAYDLPENVVSDIKWDGAHEERARFFLEDLTLLILLEAACAGVRELRLMWSYPKAFSSDRVGKLRSEWDGIITKLLEGDDRVESRTERERAADDLVPFVPDPTYETEGIATGHYFASERTIPAEPDRADIKTAAVTLDVGGGTTDISIWSKKIVLDASILLAGRQIVEVIQTSVQAGGGLFSDVLSRPAVAALESAADDPAKFAARLNLVLVEEGAAVRTALGRNINREARALRQHIALEFSAITFYTAMLLGSAAEQPGSALRREIANGGIRFHWGGNAAKFLHWVDLGGYISGGKPPEARAEPLLMAVAHQGIKDVMSRADEAKVPEGFRRLRHPLSPGHKSEAAGGLVVLLEAMQAHGAGQGTAAPEMNFLDSMDMDAAGSDSALRRDGVVCGEDIELEEASGGAGRQIRATDVITEAMLYPGNRSSIARLSLNRLTRFVDIFNHYGVHLGLLDPSEKIDLARISTDIERRVRGHYVGLEAHPAGKRVIEPVFIVEIKTLLGFLHGQA